MGTNQFDDAFAWAEEQGPLLHTDDDALQRCLRRMAKKGQLVSPHPGLFAREGYWAGLDERSRARCEMRSLARLHPDWVFSGPSAAIMHGLEVSYRFAHPLHVATCMRSHVKSSGRIIRDFIGQDRLTQGDVAEVGGVLVTSPLTTMVDCTRAMSFRYGLGVADSFLRLQGISSEQALCMVEDSYRGLRGIARTRAALRYADARSDNGGESFARATMIELGYAVPELQVEEENVVDGGHYYLDYVWPLADGTKVDGELDGHDKYVDPSMTGGRDVLAAMTDERLRESRITALGYKVMRFSMRDVRNERRFRRILDSFGIPRVR